jgi:hypothetical protein
MKTLRLFGVASVLVIALEACSFEQRIDRHTPRSCQSDAGSHARLDVAGRPENEEVALCFG